MAGNVQNVSSLIRGIQPNNALPLYNSSGNLLDLTLNDMLHAVLSNLFVVPDVRINTIIWKNWDIFNELDYTWKVIRSRPECVKLFSNDFRGLLCEPDPNSKGKYRALQLTDTLSPTTLKSNVSLEDALHICEDKANKFKTAKSRPFRGLTLFSKQRGAHKWHIFASKNDAISLDLQPHYQVEYDCFKGFESLILEIERLSKKMIPNKEWVQRSRTHEFEIYLYEQTHCDTRICPHCQIESIERYQESVRYHAGEFRTKLSSKYLDILSAYDIQIIRGLGFARK